MNYVLVGITLTVLIVTMGAFAVLGSDRLFPARRVLGYIASDGIKVETDRQEPLLISAEDRGRGYRQLRFATSVAGYNKDEVDEIFTYLIEENQRLHSELKSLGIERGNAE